MSDRIDELMRSLHEKPCVADQLLIEQKLQALRTPPTPKPTKPRDGKNGIDGVDGAAGQDGTSGIDGKAGADGANGRNGVDGVDGVDGVAGAAGAVGEAGMVFRGTYRSDSTYSIGDVVGYLGSAYVCVADTNQSPPIGFGWELLVSRGSQGIRGIKGEDGTSGGGAAAAGTLTGSTLAANVLLSSLTSVGTLAALTVGGTITIGNGALISAPSATALAIKTQVPAGTGVTPTIQVICPSSATALNSSSFAQNVFPSGAFDTISVQAATTYMFDGLYIIKTTGTVSHTISMSFALTTATITNCSWTTMSYPLGTPLPVVAIRAQDANLFITVGGGLVNSTNASAHNVVKFEGIMRVNAAGNVVPQITFSAIPTGTNTLEIGSYLRFYPIGSNTIDSVGTAIT